MYFLINSFIILFIVCHENLSLTCMETEHLFEFVQIRFIPFIQYYEINAALLKPNI